MTDTFDLAAMIADREKGTPGPWRTVYYDAGDKDEWDNCPLIDGPKDYDAAVVHWDGFKQRFWQSAHGDQRAIDANARRIARVPEMEAEILRLREGLTEIERLYYTEAKDASWRAAQMRAIAQEMLK